MQWVRASEAQSMAFSSPDARVLSFRLPVSVGFRQAERKALRAFGYRGRVKREDRSLVVERTPVLTRAMQRRNEKKRRKGLQTKRLAGGGACGGRVRI